MERQRIAEKHVHNIVRAELNNKHGGQAVMSTAISNNTANQRMMYALSRDAVVLACSIR